METAAKNLPAEQKVALLHYMGLSAGVFQLQDVLDTALLLESLARYVSSSKQDITHHSTYFSEQISMFSFIFFVYIFPHLHSRSADETSLDTHGAAGGPRRDFLAFVDRFPVSLEGVPPSKKKRMESGFPEDRIFYDKWRATQYAQREKHLLCKSLNPSIQH